MKNVLKPMNNHFLNETQATLKLLAVLRLMAFSSVVLLFAVGEWLQLHALQMMVNWQHIAIASALALMISLLSFMFVTQVKSSKAVYVLLLIDTVLWFYLLDASGGSMNPAISYLLVLLSIGALSLSLWHSALLLIIMMALYTIMMKTQPSSHHAHMFVWHLWGMWVLFLFNALIMMMVIYFLSRRLRQQDKALAAYKEETARSEQMIMLGTMAANITHELGTPLSTIAMLMDDKNDEDAILIKKQIQRCKDTLSLLKTVDLDNKADTLIQAEQMLMHIKHELQLLKPSATLVIEADKTLKIKNTSLLNQALLSLVNNAVDAAKEQVTLNIYSHEHEVFIDIEHDGLPIKESLIKQLGLQLVKSTSNGLGMGYYLANASIERLGGRLQISNQNDTVLTRIVFKASDIAA